MGIERSFQTIPESSNLLVWARTERELGKILFLAPWYFKQGSRPSLGPTTPASEAMHRFVRDLVAADPGLTTQNYYVDRRWDQIHYLLSGKYRGGAVGPDDALFDVSIEGDALIAEHVRGGQGYPLRYTSPQLVAAVASAFERINIDSLRANYDLAVMEARSVYKAFAGRETQEDWEYLSTLIRGLRAFYLNAARTGSGVLVCTD